MKKVVLVYSGGLDTSVCIPMMKEFYGFDQVVTVTVDVGQPAEDIQQAEERARLLGTEHYTIDAKAEFVRDYVFPAIKANGDYQGYPLSTSIARPLIAAKSVEIAQKVFHRGAMEYTIMLTFSGAGSVVGALVVAWLGKYNRMGTAALFTLVAVGLLIATFAASRIFWVSNLLLFVGGAALVAAFSSVMSLVQLVAPNEMRGRVMSIYMVAFRGGIPLGSLASGYLATLTSAPLVVGLNGMLLVVVALFFLATSRKLREV